MFTLAKRFDDEGEVEEAEEEDIEFLEAGEDSAEPLLKSPEEPLDFVALLVEGAVVFPGLDAVGLWRNDRDHTQAKHQLLVSSPS